MVIAAYRRFRTRRSSSNRRYVARPVTSALPARSGGRFQGDDIGQFSGKCDEGCLKVGTRYLEIAKGHPRGDKSTNRGVGVKRIENDLGSSHACRIDTVELTHL